MSVVRNGEQKGHKYLYSEIFYGGQKLHKYFCSLRVRVTSQLTCSQPEYGVEQAYAGWDG